MRCRCRWGGRVFSNNNDNGLIPIFLKFIFLLSSLDLSNSIFSKLSAKNLNALSTLDFLLFNALDKGTSTNAHVSMTSVPILVHIVKTLESKELKSSRSPNIITFVENSDMCKVLLDEVNALISKEIVSVICHSKMSKEIRAVIKKLPLNDLKADSKFQFIITSTASNDAVDKFISKSITGCINVTEIKEVLILGPL